MCVLLTFSLTNEHKEQRCQYSNVNHILKTIKIRRHSQSFAYSINNEKDLLTFLISCMERKKMKVTSVLPLSLSLILWYLSIQKCYAGEADFVREFLKARHANRLHTTSINNGLEAAEKQRSAFVPQVGSKEDDKSSALPGQPSGVNFDQYSGYVTVDDDAGRTLFYYFTESTQDPSTKPLILWLNGGKYTHRTHNTPIVKRKNVLLTLVSCKTTKSLI